MNACDSKRLIERYPRRDYTVQYNESDYEFVSRLMQEWGITLNDSSKVGLHWIDIGSRAVLPAKGATHSFKFAVR
jgi:uncharacterized protein involved in type VI secretion and phage assembly